MANDLTSNRRLWVLDSCGVLSTTPVWIDKIIYIPSAASDDVTFKEWNPNSTVSAGTKYLKTGTITGDDTLTSAGNLPSSIADGYIFEITAGSGASANVSTSLVKTAGTDDAVVIHDNDWTNEASKIYSWTTYATTTALIYKAGASDASPIRDIFDPPRWFENLALDVIDGGTLYVYLR